VLDAVTRQKTKDKVETRLCGISSAKFPNIALGLKIEIKEQVEIYYRLLF
jgi:hypothetical protein